MSKASKSISNYSIKGLSYILKSYPIFVGRDSVIENK